MVNVMDWADKNRNTSIGVGVVLLIVGLVLANAAWSVPVIGPFLDPLSNIVTQVI